MQAGGLDCSEYVRQTPSSPPCILHTQVVHGKPAEGLEEKLVEGPAMASLLRIRSINQSHSAYSAIYETLCV